VRLPSDFFEWSWLILFLLVCTVRKIHEHRAGDRTSLRGVHAVEAALMLLWGCLAGVAPLLLIFTPVLDFAGYPFDLPWGFRAFGLVAFAAAIWLVHRSHADLGRLWSSTVEFRDEHTLVTDGVYRLVRHPMYAAHIVWGVAQALLLPNYVAGPLALPVMVAILNVRAPREERAMILRFGEQYIAYMNRTGRVLPKRPALQR
jgi:protein-S-isoprenylcysteine O-methyltransferase Ste14